MTTIDNPTSEQLVPSRAGGIGGLVAAATFIFGIALFVTIFSDYTEGDATVAESVDFLVSHQGTLFAWYFVMFLVFGVAIIPLARSLRERLVDVNPELADIGTVFAYIWAGLMFATGMTHNVGITAVANLNETARHRPKRSGRPCPLSPTASAAATSSSVGCGSCW